MKFVNVLILKATLDFTVIAGLQSHVLTVNVMLMVRLFARRLIVQL